VCYEDVQKAQEKYNKRENECKKLPYKKYKYKNCVGFEEKCATTEKRVSSK
jgi:hypothetical protein